MTYTRTAPAAGSIHVAGEPVGLEQRCVRCGLKLVDFGIVESVDALARVNEARPIFFTQGRAVRQTASGFETYDLGVAVTAAGEIDGLCTLAPRGTPGVI